MSSGLEPGFFQRYPVDAVALQADRTGRARAVLADRQWDALLVASGAALGQRGNVRYLANYATTTRYSILLSPAQGDAVLFVPYPVHVYWAEGLTWTPHVRYTANPAADIARAIHDSGARAIALAGKEFLPAGMEPALREALAPVTVEDGAAAFRGLRTIKSTADRAGMLLAARLADDAFRYILPLIRSGVTENDLVAEIQYFLRKAGAEDSLILITASALRAHPIPAHRPLAPGDVLQLSIEPIAPGGYWCQTIRVMSLGRPSAELLGAYGACLDSQQAMEGMLKPGTLARDVCARGQRALGHLAGTDTTPLGHGMGLDLGEPPRIEPGDSTPLQTGMFITLHPSVHTGRLGVFIGDTYHMSPEGTRRLSTLPQEIMIIP